MSARYSNVVFILSSAASSHKFQLNSQIVSRSVYTHTVQPMKKHHSDSNLWPFASKQKEKLFACSGIFIINSIGIYSNVYCYCHIRFVSTCFFGISITSHKYEPQNNGNDFLLHLDFCSLCDVLDFIVSSYG